MLYEIIIVYCKVSNTVNQHHTGNQHGHISQLHFIAQ